ncbi:MAG: Styrene monooxygenase StyA, partial [Pseudomonadota bacterium]
MRKFTIIGGGQSGLMVAIGLLKAGHQVRVVQNRTADEIEKGRVLSSQCMFSNAVQNERDLGLDFWSDSCPPVQGINFIVPNPDGSGSKVIDWASQLDQNAYAVDQRVKMPRWLAEFLKLGGHLVIKDAGLSDIDEYARQDDLVIVASGKGEVGQMFARDAQKSAYDKPMRALALTYVKGMTPREPHSAVEFNLIPGVGEYFVFPALTTTGPCEIMVFEGIP